MRTSSPGSIDSRFSVCVHSASQVRGAVAQLGERLNGIQEVEGSIPFGSTSFFPCRQVRGQKAPRPDRPSGTLGAFFILSPPITTSRGTPIASAQWRGAYPEFFRD